MDRKAFLDVDRDLGGEFEVAEGEIDDAEGGVLFGIAAFGAGDAGVIGREGDGGVGVRTGGDGDEVVKGQGLVEGRERVESVRAQGADGEAEVDLAEGANARGHQGDCSGALIRDQGGSG